MDVEQFKDDVREGRITVDRLIELIVTLQRELQTAKQRIADLERQLGGSPTEKLSQPFSVRAEEQRQESRGKKRRKRKPSRGGRTTTAEKVAQADADRESLSGGLAESRLLAVAHAAGVAVGERPGGARGL